MAAPRELHYRLPHRSVGWRPGSHPGSSLGAGQQFIAHVKLYDRPDPRRLDLRASLRDVRGDWLVRVSRQRVSTPICVIADVSASMNFGTPKTKLQVLADFLEALGQSAFRLADPVGLLAFDARDRTDLFVPAVLSRGVASVMAEKLANRQTSAGGVEGLEQAALHAVGRHGLVFLASDFHWPLDRLGGVLDLLAAAYVVPIVIWDPAEIQPPSRDGLICLRDAESGAQRTVWSGRGLRKRWREAMERRRSELEQLFAARGVRAFHVSGEFDADAMSRYFFEAVA